MKNAALLDPARRMRARITNWARGLLLMTDELKPCPFCGGKATVVHMARVGVCHVRCEHGECPVLCKTSGDSKEEAIEIWNRHASDWRSCKDSHPEIGQTVLIAEKTGIQCRPYNIQWAKYNKRGYRCRGLYYRAVWWMAVPELPDLPEETEE
jgi:hypothetical protein